MASEGVGKATEASERDSTSAENISEESGFLLMHLVEYSNGEAALMGMMPATTILELDGLRESNEGLQRSLEGLLSFKLRVLECPHELAGRAFKGV